ncbi:MAG: YHS domain-containing (seleno)protein [Cytophagales bacterium]|nr:YHS domain-containing (seleno)protein [Cytophagales bacterium]
MKTLLIFLATLALDTDPKELFKPGEVAFDGFDLVSYYQEGPVTGNATYAYEYQGITMHFSSEENLNLFKQYPERYWPALDGWCAISLVYEVLKRPDFTIYKIQNNKLYFFEVRAFFNGLTHWDRDPVKNEILARVHYKHLGGY